MAKNSDFLAPGFIDFGNTLFDKEGQAVFEVSKDGDIAVTSPFSIPLSDGRTLYIGLDGEIIGIK